MRHWVHPAETPESQGRSQGHTSVEFPTRRGQNGHVETLPIAEHPTAPALYRRSDKQIVSGLAAGLGDAIGVEASYVRAGFVVLSFAGGVGVLAYLLGWVLLRDAAQNHGSMKEISRSQKIGVGFMLIAALIMLSTVGLWFGDSVVWPIGLISFGLAVIWDRSDRPDRLAQWALPGLDDDTRPSASRLALGTIVLFAGLAAFAASRSAIEALGAPLLAIAVTVVGLMLLFGPWIWRLASDLNEERIGRIRSDERTEVASHLHDSVLQTLALIQRAEDPRRMVTLARAQERELRQWLYDRKEAPGEETLLAALETAAGRVESSYNIPVEVVGVGEVIVDDALNALVRAAAEAMANAANHSGADRVSVFAESTPDSVTVYISDQGKGFDLAAIGDDRHGILDSITGRMERHGGSSSIASVIGEGTEIELSMPKESE